MTDGHSILLEDCSTKCNTFRKKNKRDAVRSVTGELPQVAKCSNTPCTDFQSSSILQQNNEGAGNGVVGTVSRTFRNSSSGFGILVAVKWSDFEYRCQGVCGILCKLRYSLEKVVLSLFLVPKVYPLFEGVQACERLQLFVVGVPTPLHVLHNALFLSSAQVQCISRRISDCCTVQRLSRRNFVRARSIATGGRVRGSGRGERGCVRDPAAGGGVRGVDIRHRARGRAGGGGERGHARAGHDNFDGTIGAHPHPVVVDRLSAGERVDTLYADLTGTGFRST